MNDDENNWVIVEGREEPADKWRRFLFKFEHINAYQSSYLSIMRHKPTQGNAAINIKTGMFFYGDNYLPIGDVPRVQLSEIVED